MPPLLQRFLTKYTLLAASCCLLAWVAALINGAFTIRDAATGSHFITKIGPFYLNELAKMPLANGYTIRLRFLGGITGYFFSCIVLGLIIGFTVFQLNKNKARPKH